MRKLLAFLLVSVAAVAHAQIGVRAFTYSAGSWNAALSTSTTTLGVPDTAVDLYCYNSSLQSWVPADSSCFGGSGGGDTITSPNSTLSVGGTSTNTTLDINLGHANVYTATQSGTIAAATVANTGAVTTNASFFLCFLSANTTSQEACNTATALTFNPTNGNFSSTIFTTASTATYITGASVDVASTGGFAWSSTSTGNGTADTVECRKSAGVAEYNAGSGCGSTGTLDYALWAPGIIYSAAGTALPSCTSGLNGYRAVVSDATSPTYHGTYTSGGTVTSPVYCNGATTTWLTD